ncbi:hypothetical protein NOK12_00950 [Nocardioides sp. OK12]|nr:hypothetical protein NOK12_00950 [Nocardioides sp. OK12]
MPIHFFSPLSTQPSPSRRAVVARPIEMAEPTSGSVRPKAPISSIRAIAGSQRSRCSSEPHRWIEPIASPPWTPMKVPMEGSMRLSSIATMPSTSAPRAGQPGPS